MEVLPGKTVDAGEGAGGRVSLEVMDDGLGEDVSFDVEAVTDGGVSEGGQFERGGDEGDLEGVVVRGGDGEAYAVDGDRAFGDDVIDQVRGRLNGEAVFFAVALDVDDATEAVDVSLHEVAAEGLVGGHCGFEVDLVADDELAELGASECFEDDVEGEGGFGDVGDGEAGAGDADGLALLDEAIVRQAGGRAVDGKAQAKRLAVELGNGGFGLNDASEHED